MTENPIPEGILPEIASIRAWIEQEVINRGTCPPLNVVAQKCGGNNGVDWNRLSREVDIVSLFPLSDVDLNRRATSEYLNFLNTTNQGTAPMTRIFVLPDFLTNDAYDFFIFSMKNNAKKWFITTKDGMETAREAVLKIAKARGIPGTSVREILTRSDAPVEIANAIVDGFLMPTHFYGKNISRLDLTTFPVTRGPVERQQMLSRAPYYAFQLINPIRAANLSAHLNRQRLEEHNTEIALGVNMGRYGGVMNKLRAIGS
jgi:hypothetical protein